MKCKLMLFIWPFATTKPYKPLLEAIKQYLLLLDLAMAGQLTSKIKIPRLAK